jgi:hypothetical protein
MGWLYLVQDRDQWCIKMLEILELLRSSGFQEGRSTMEIFVS